MHFLWECKMVQLLWKSLVISLKIKELPHDPAIPLLGIYLKEQKTCIQTEICTQMCIAALFTIARKWEQPRCPMNGYNKI